MNRGLTREVLGKLERGGNDRKRAKIFSGQGMISSGSWKLLCRIIHISINARED